MLNLGVYLVTDSALIAAAGHDLVSTVSEAVAGGVTAVQLREKDAPGRDFLEVALRVAAVLPESVPLIINDRVDVFLAARAAGARVAGVHLGQSDLPATLVRELVGTDAIVGLSAATPSELADVDPTKVDYVGIGALHTTQTKSDAPPALGIEGFARLVELCSVPAVAIGGVSAADLGPLRAAGAAGGAVVSAICSAPDPRLAAQNLARAWDAPAGP